MFRVELFTMTKDGNNPNVHQLMNGKTNVVIHTKEYHSAIKRNSALIHISIWLNLKTLC